jgi:endogenous inhibitor of DNA gyrase (YacG/DUF329 family)
MKNEGKIARLVPGDRKTRRSCPICRRPAVPAFRPFCSDRCRRVDLDRWLGEAYRLPAEEESKREPDEE